VVRDAEQELDTRNRRYAEGAHDSERVQVGGERSNAERKAKMTLADARAHGTEAWHTTRRHFAHDERGHEGGANARSMSITEGNGSAAPQVTQRTAHDERGQEGEANARSMSITEGNGSAAPQVTQRSAHDERGQGGGPWSERAEHEQ